MRNCGSEIDQFCLHPIHLPFLHMLVQSCQPSPTRFGSLKRRRFGISNSSFSIPDLGKATVFCSALEKIRRTRTGPAKMVRYFPPFRRLHQPNAFFFFMPKGEIDAFNPLGETNCPCSLGSYFPDIFRRKSSRQKRQGCPLTANNGHPCCPIELAANGIPAI